MENFLQINAFYALGWLRLERLVEIKKILFIRTICCLDDDIGIKKIFSERADLFFNHLGELGLGLVFDLINTPISFGVGEYVKTFVCVGNDISKSKWREIVWNRERE